jgi:hypothetical protein
MFSLPGEVETDAASGPKNEHVRSVHIYISGLVTDAIVYGTAAELTELYFFLCQLNLLLQFSLSPSFGMFVPLLKLRWRTPTLISLLRDSVHPITLILAERAAMTVS